MLTKLQLASVWSEDLNNLLPFYRDTLGLPVSMQADDFVILGDLGGAALALGTHSEVHGKATDPARHMIAFQTDDIQAETKRLKDAGVEFIEEPNEFPNGWVATMKDPEGNYVQLFQDK